MKVAGSILSVGYISSQESILLLWLNDFFVLTVVLLKSSQWLLKKIKSRKASICALKKNMYRIRQEKNTEKGTENLGKVLFNKQKLQAESI